MCNDSPTSETSTVASSQVKLTLFPVDSRASHFPSPEPETVETMTVRSGRKCFELYGQFSPLGLLAKTLLESSAWNSIRCLLTWKASATPRKRLLFRLVPSTPSTDEIEFGLLPTPKAQSANAPGFHGNGGQDIQTTIAVMAGLMPTPTAQDAKNSTCPPSQKDRDSVPGHLLRLISTLNASDGKSGDYGRNRSKHRPSGARKQMNVATAIGDIAERQTKSGNPTIHPTFYERLMGFPDGWTDVTPE